MVSRVFQGLSDSNLRRGKGCSTFCRWIPTDKEVLQTREPSYLEQTLLDLFSRTCCCWISTDANVVLTRREMSSIKQALLGLLRAIHGFLSQGRTNMFFQSTLTDTKQFFGDTSHSTQYFLQVPLRDIPPLNGPWNSSLFTSGAPREGGCSEIGWLEPIRLVNLHNPI